MTDDLPDTGSLGQDLRIDAACDRFEAALRAGGRADPAEYLADAHESDRPRLEVELRRVLDAFHAAALAPADPAGFAPGGRVGPYTLGGKLGEGGMGEVWAARQDEPVRRRAALKFVKPGMDSRAVLARFAQERQALALLDHPNIARVLDAGLTPDGRPYFAMELVDGLPLTRFCDDHRLGIADRLRVFVTVCRAVQHAHQKGVIHRDLKPSNVLVAHADGGPVVKVIDFGVAKATCGKLTDESVSTHPGAVVGTLEYMAPEQAGGDGADVDTRADVYSLGVILYELLTGLRPFDGRRARGGVEEFLRTLREVDPPRPSTRLSSDESLPSLAAARRTEPRALTALMRGDLDWVVMKCLEKDRDRRYGTASDLGRDVERFLADEPVEARPASTGYRLWKFVRRNRGPVLAGGLLVAALLAAAGGTSWGVVQARRAEAAAVADRNDKELALRNEAAERAAAQAERAQAEQARDTAGKRLEQVLNGNRVILSIIEDVNVNNVRIGDLPLEAILAKRLVAAGKLLDGEAIGDPLEVAALQGRFGGALLSLGYATDAIPLFEKCRATYHRLLGPEDRKTLTAAYNLSMALGGVGDAARTVPVLEQVLRVERAKFPEDPQTLKTMGLLAIAYNSAGERGRAVPLLEEAYRRQYGRFGPNHRDTRTTLNNLATAYSTEGRNDLALPMQEEAVRLCTRTLGPDHPDTLAARGNLAGCYSAAGRAGEAQSLREEVLGRMRARLGPDHPTTMLCLFQLGNLLEARGQYADALPLMEEALRAQRRKLGRDHPLTLITAVCVGRCYAELKRFDDGLPLLEEALKLRRARSGPDHPRTLHATAALGAGLLLAARPADALPRLAEAAKLQREKLGPDHPDTMSTTTLMANCLRKLGRTDEAIAVYAAAADRLRATRGREYRTTLNCVDGLAAAYQDKGRLDAAVPLFEETLGLRKRVFGPDHPATLAGAQRLAAALRAAKDYARALPLLEDSAAGFERVLGADHPDALTARHNLANCYRAANKPDRAIPHFEAALAGMKARHGDDHRDTLVCTTNLASAYAATGRADRAYPLFEDAVRLFGATAGPDDPLALWCMHHYASSCLAAGDHTRAVRLGAETLARRRAKLGPDHPDTLAIMNELAVMHVAAGDAARAVPLLEEALAGRTALNGPDHPDTMSVVGNLAATYQRTGQPDKERALREQSLAALKGKLPAGHAKVAAALDALADCEFRAGRFAAAEARWRECLPGFEAPSPPGWRPAAVRAMIGAALLEQKKYAEAEPYLTEGYAELKKRAKSLPPAAAKRLSEAADRLVALYTALGRPADAEKWRTERSGYKNLPAKK